MYSRGLRHWRACVPLFHLWELAHWCTTNPSSDSNIVTHDACDFFRGKYFPLPKSLRIPAILRVFPCCPLERLKPNMGRWNKTHQCRPRWDNDQQKQGQWLYLHSLQSWSPRWATLPITPPSVPCPEKFMPSQSYSNCFGTNMPSGIVNTNMLESSSLKSPSVCWMPHTKLPKALTDLRRQVLPFRCWT